jgi:hypothetical protein
LREKALCKNFAAFQARGVAVRSDDEFAFGAELVDYAVDQGRLGSDDGEIGADAFGDVEERGGFGYAGTDARDPGITWVGEDFHVRRLRQFPTQRMLAPAAAEDQNLHCRYNHSVQEKYDVVVIGAGHAGCEAARACARMGLKTAMVTMNLDLIAQMSCNPAIGGIAKGHLVREIDALGGVMGVVADEVGIQFRLLNTSRGPAVWSPRAQMDKRMYRVRMREVLEKEPNLRIKQAEVAALTLAEDRRVTGVLLRDGRTIPAAAVVVTTGTFLNGLAHVGESKYSCGRNGEAPSQLAGRPTADIGAELDAAEDGDAAAARWTDD